MGGGGEDFDMGFDRFPMGPGDVVGGPQEPGRDGNCRLSSTFANGKRSNKTHGHAISTCIWFWKERSMSPRRATEEEKGRSQQWF
jgi:hypothetical protein